MALLGTTLIAFGSMPLYNPAGPSFLRMVAKACLVLLKAKVQRKGDLEQCKTSTKKNESHL